MIVFLENWLSFYPLQDEDFVADKDDEGSPTDDSGGDGSDDSDSGDEEASSFFLQKYLRKCVKIGSISSHEIFIVSCRNMLEKSRERNLHQWRQQSVRRKWKLVMKKVQRRENRRRKKIQMHRRRQCPVTCSSCRMRERWISFHASTNLMFNNEFNSMIILFSGCLLA